MSVLTATRQATLPRVNLLPPEIEEQRRFRRVQGGLGLVVLAAVAAVAALYVLAASEVGRAEAELATTQAEAAQLQTEADKYADVPRVYAQVDAKETQVSQAMSQEVRWSYYLNDLSLSIPSEVWVTDMTMTQAVDQPAASAAGAAPAVPGSEFSETGIGQVTFTGMAFSHDDVAAWLESLAQQEGYSQAYFTSSTVEPIGDRDAVSFASQVTLTPEALSERYEAEVAQ